jgi:hypothetical protein
MSTCSTDHASSTDDYCEVCGAPIGVPSSAPERPRDDIDRSRPTEVVAPARAEPGLDRCPACSKPRATGHRFCESCRHEFDLAAAPAPSWVAEVSADRAYSESVVPDGVNFPRGRQPSVLPLGPGDVMIGRFGDPPGPRPDIDLTGPLDDPYVSRRHARLVPRNQGDYQIIDTDSTNGTRVNDELTPIKPGTPRGLSDGDRIHVGAWTTITLRWSPRP